MINLQYVCLFSYLGELNPCSNVEYCGAYGQCVVGEGGVCETITSSGTDFWFDTATYYSMYTSMIKNSAYCICDDNYVGDRCDINTNAKFAYTLTFTILDLPFNDTYMDQNSTDYKNIKSQLDSIFGSLNIDDDFKPYHSSYIFTSGSSVVTIFKIDVKVSVHYLEDAYRAHLSTDGTFKVQNDSFSVTALNDNQGKQPIKG